MLFYCVHNLHINITMIQAKIMFGPLAYFCAVQAGLCQIWLETQIVGFLIPSVIFPKSFYGKIDS